MYARISRLSSVLKYIGQLDFPVWIDQDVYVETINWPIRINRFILPVSWELYQRMRSMISLWEFIIIYGVRGKKQKYKLFANARHIRTNRIDILSTFLIYHGEMFRANAMDICNYPKNDKNSCEKLLLRIDVRVREVKFYKLKWTRQVECKLWMVVKSRGQGLEVYLAAVAKWCLPLKLV